MARLEIQGISQGFGEVDVLRDVTLDVESGPQNVHFVREGAHRDGTA